MHTPTTARLVGSRLPDPIRTGAYAYSSGLIEGLSPGFHADDLQALDAPKFIPSGSLTMLSWTVRGSGELVGFPVASMVRPS